MANFREWSSEENRGETKERAISASVSPKIERVLKDIAREQGQPDPF